MQTGCRQIAVGTPCIERQIRRRFNIDVNGRGMDVDVNTHVRLLLEGEVDGVSGLVFFEGVSRKARILGGDMDMNGLAAGACVDIEMAVAGAQEE